MTHWFISDTHFGQANILTFKRDDGTPLRPFQTLEEMDETLVANWNAVVAPTDKVYHLGDAVMHRRNLHILGRLNGKKRLVRGNHDIFKTADYLPYFEEILGVRVFNGLKNHDRIIASHIPIHKESMSRFILNVHGHLHANKLKDKQYRCVSVEHTNYAPISFDEILKDLYQ